MSKHAEESVKNVNATMALEGMPLSESDIELISKIADGILTIDDAIAILNARFAINGQ